MPAHCICAKNWEACPIHDWERATSIHLDARHNEEKAQRDIRRRRKLSHTRKNDNRQEF